MKTDAISRRELPKLIRRIQEKGFFAGVRGGHHVIIDLDPAPLVDAPPYRLAFRRGATWIFDRARSVYEASDIINQLARRGARA